MTIKNVFFDFDGVLIDSEILYCKFVTEALKRDFNFDLSIEDYSKNYAGQDLRKSLKQMGVFTNDGDIEEFAAKITAETKECKKDHIVAIENSKKVIKELNVPCAITSSGDSKSIKHALKVTGLDEVFKGPIFSGMDIGKLKPDPAVYLKALKDLNVNPEEVLVVEDSSYGTQAAKRAGISKVLGFTGGSHSYNGHSERLLDAGAYQTSETLLKVLKLTEK